MQIISDFPFYQEFDDFIKVKYPEEYDNFTDKDKIFKYEVIFKLGLNLAKKYTEQNRSCDLLYNDKPPRADMVEKLGNILFELEVIQSFPIVPPLQVSAAVKKVLSSKDKRTKDKYMKWITSISNYDRTFNKVDLTHLVNIFPKSKIIKGDLW